jgi:outer membrane lipoprotein-sorting protein
MIHIKSTVFIALLFLSSIPAQSQDINSVLQRVKEKLEKINKYEAVGTLKTSIAYLKIPVAKVTVLFRKPNELSITSKNGVTFIPKGVRAISLQNILSNEYTIIDGGKETVNNKTLRVVRLLPISQENNIVLSTLYINETDFVVEKSSTTTKEEGTYEMKMEYGKYKKYGLPDKLVFTFNAKDYKIPKGLTLDFDNATSKNQKMDKNSMNKGKAEIQFDNYTIN